MTSPFRSELASLGERLRRAEEANVVLGEELAQLEKELALRGELRGPSRARARAAVWAAVALLALGLGSLAGSAAFERSNRREAILDAFRDDAERSSELRDQQVARSACTQSLELLAYNQGLCEQSQPSK